MKIIINSILGLVLLMGIASAVTPYVEINLNGNNLSVHGLVDYNLGSITGKVPSDFIQSISEILIPVCTNTTSYDNSTGINTTVVTKSCYHNYSKQIPLIFTNSSDNTVITTEGMQAKYDECVAQREQYNAGLNSCFTAQQLQGDYKANYTTCSTELLTCNTNVQILTADKNTLQKQFDDNKNSKYIWGVLGIILGVAAVMFKQGKIGGPKHRENESFNPRMSS